MTIAAMEPTVQRNQFPESDSERNKLGRSDFLKMFITQMQHQDPLNPMEGTEFTTQLAQFSSLEQLFNINDTAQEMLTSHDNLIRIQALKLIGEEVRAQGNAVILQDSGVAKGTFALMEAATQCTAFVYNEAGDLVRTLELGSLEAGRNQFEWDGLDSNGQDLPAGTYTFQISAANPENDAVEVETHTSGVVTGVKLGGISPVLLLDETEIPLFEVIEVRSLASASADDAGQN